MGIKPSSDLTKEKKPLYMTVYEKLYAGIMDGMFPSESRLPTEPELAKMLGVSRMTLRQALARLQDDGLVSMVHGKGNFIIKTPNVKKTDGLEKIGNPIYKCHTEAIDEVELLLRLDLENEYTQQVLQRKAAAVVAFERWYKQKGEAVAYSFTYMAIEEVSDLNLDLNNEQEILQFLETEVYKLAHSATIEIRSSSYINRSPSKYTLVGGESCDLILESVYSHKQQFPIVYNKYYIPKEFSSLIINAIK